MIVQSTMTSSSTLLKRLKDALPNYATQREMAELMGIDKATLNRWLQGTQPPNPRLSQLESIAAELGIPVSALVSSDQPVPAARRAKVAPPPPAMTPAAARALREQLRRLDAVLAKLESDEG